MLDNLILVCFGDSGVDLPCDLTLGLLPSILGPVRESSLTPPGASRWPQGHVQHPCLNLSCSNPGFGLEDLTVSFCTPCKQRSVTLQSPILSAVRFACCHVSFSASFFEDQASVCASWLCRPNLACTCFRAFSLQFLRSRVACRFCTSGRAP